jgi:hypothetical protein
MLPEKWKMELGRYRWRGRTPLRRHKKQSVLVALPDVIVVGQGTLVQPIIRSLP